MELVFACPFSLSLLLPPFDLLGVEEPCLERPFSAPEFWCFFLVAICLADDYFRCSSFYFRKFPKADSNSSQDWKVMSYEYKTLNLYGKLDKVAAAELGKNRFHPTLTK